MFCVLGFLWKEVLTEQFLTNFICIFIFFEENLQPKLTSSYCTNQKKTNRSFLQHLTIRVFIKLNIGSLIDARYKIIFSAG